MKWVKVVKYMVADGNLTVGGEPTIVHTDIELQCCTPEVGS